MKNFILGQQVIDIRNGEYHIVTDYEFLDESLLIYTDKKSCIHEQFIIDTDKCISVQLINKKLNGECVSDWLIENGKLQTIKVNYDFDIEKHLDKFFK
jgi:hypothetical protein